jgi:hypothetical protein
MRVALVPLVLALSGCPEPIVRSPDATPEPIDGTGCQAAEEHLVAMGCPEQRSKKGTPYGVVCRDAAEQGIDLHTCVAAAASCEAVRACR